MKANIYTLSLLATAIFIAAPPALAYDQSWDGNHPDAQSEAWTWMGHLSEVEAKNGVPTLGSNGLGFIFYYTRSVEKTLGTMTFRSSALTTTKDGVGTAFRTDTIYAAQHDDGALRVRTGSLDLTFTAGAVYDRALTMPMTAEDDRALARTLKLFPNLGVTPGFAPKKTVYREVERDGTIVDLTFYSIWPILSAPNGQMRFLGQDGTYTYSEPMLVTTGTVGGKAMAGLSFLDRQWATKSFGEFVMNGLTGLMRYGQALNYAHAWSAFHAQNQRTGEWSFFHLWHQWSRAEGRRDTLDQYSGLLYMRDNGRTSALVNSDDYAWKASGFVRQTGRQIVMDYSKGRDGFFPSRADVSSRKLGLDYTLFASPALQNLNQPIPFYEGFASGDGVWEGDRITIKGRLESSRLMFRDQDYEEVLETLATVEPAWAQPDVQAFLRAKPKAPPMDWLTRQLHVLSSLFGSMPLKLSIVRDLLSGVAAAPDSIDPTVTVYQ